jgi:two-component system sensor histidine kinase RegB
VILSEIDSHTNLKALTAESPEPITAMIEEIIYSRLSQNQTNFKLVYNRENAVPLLWRRPELVHALENLLQNALEFSAHDVTINIEWTAIDLHITIVDDGNGFNAATLARAGQPWNSTRAGQQGHRGLGLFIARSLLESIGGAISFANDQRGGGKVKISLPRESLS